MILPYRARSPISQKAQSFLRQDKPHQPYFLCRESPPAEKETESDGFWSSDFSRFRTLRWLSTAESLNTQIPAHRAIGRSRVQDSSFVLRGFGEIPLARPGCIRTRAWIPRGFIPNIGSRVGEFHSNEDDCTSRYL